VWLVAESVGAEFVEDVFASSVDAAVKQVMTEQNVSYASYVWVLPDLLADELEGDQAERFDVFLSDLVGG